MIGVSTIETENRMKEIAGNLKRDMKDLLGESANIVSGFFKRGACTVRGMADRWKNFTQDISGAVGTLFQPFENALPPALPPEREPMVTVMESGAPELPVGTRMTLYEAETRITRLNSERWNSDGEPSPVRVAIDYIMEGEQDRYWLPLDIGAGCPSMLDQMEDYVTACFYHPNVVAQDFYNATEGLGALLHERFGPQLQDDLEKLSSKVLGFFRQHCTISRMEEQFEVQAEAMPQNGRKQFERSMAETITALRLGRQHRPASTRPPAGTGAAHPAGGTAPHIPGQASPTGGRAGPPAFRQGNAEKIKEGQAANTTPRKGRASPQR